MAATWSSRPAAGEDTTEAPGGLTDKTGTVAEGAIGDMKWQVPVVAPGPKSPVPADSCYTIAIFAGSDIHGDVHDLPGLLGGGLGCSGPAGGFTGVG